MTRHADTLNTKGADLALSIEQILSRLTVCLNQETEAIIQNNRNAAQALQDQKIRLMEQYRSLSETLERDPTALDSIDTRVRTHLQKIGKDFQTALKHNAKAIKAAHNAVTRLMDRIMHTARRALMDGQQYNAKGALAGYGNTQASAAPTKVNEEL